MTINHKPQSGLIVKQPYANQIINGEKKIEYRSRKPPFRYRKIPIYLLSEGKVLGVIIIHDHHQVDSDTWAWEVEDIHKYKLPEKYRHPCGAQVWVKNVYTIQSRLRSR